MRLLFLSLLLIALTACVPALGEWDPLAVEPQRPTLPADLDPNDAHALYAYGSLVLEGSPRRAAEFFHWASRLDPTWADPLYARRLALLMSDRAIFSEYMQASPKLLRSPGMQKVDSLYRHALMLNPFLQQRHYFTAVKQALARSVEQEIRRANPGAPIHSGEIESYIERTLRNGDPETAAWVAHSEGRFGAAQENYRRALRRSKERAYLHAGLARVLVLAGRFGEARDEMMLALKEMRETDEKKLVRVYESKALYEHSIGLIMEQLGDQTGAREAYGRALQEDLSYYPSHLRLGELALSAGDTTAALAEFELAVQIRGDDAGVRYKYADLLQRAGRSEAAESEARLAIEAEPLFALPYLVLADAAQAQGKGGEAATHYGAFLERASRTAEQRPYAEGRLSALGGATTEEGRR